MNGLFCPCEPHHPSPSSHPRLLPLLADATTSPGPAGREAALRPAAPAPSSLWVDTLLKWITFAPAKKVIPRHSDHLQQLTHISFWVNLNLATVTALTLDGSTSSKPAQLMVNQINLTRKNNGHIGGAVDITLDLQEKQTLYSTTKSFPWLN